MFANTKQVRKIGNAIAGFGAQWTDETNRIVRSARRSVTWAFWDAGRADAVAAKLREELARQGFANTVKVTQGMYMRVIANLA